MTGRSGVSVVIPVTERCDDIRTLTKIYLDALIGLCRPIQFIFVLDGPFAYLAEELRQIEREPHAIEIISLTRTFGESVALTLGFERAAYDLILTLPAYQQIELKGLPRLFELIEGADMVIVRRWPRLDSAANQFAARVFHAILRIMTRLSYNDLGCGVRLIRRRVLDEITLYGDQHRFLPILAERRGFRIVETDQPQAKSEANLRVYRPGVYVSRLLDLMGVFFVVRFTKKPLRFFGMVGSVLLAAGSLILIIAVVQRFLMSMALADRPILLLGSLLVVLGVQLFALGLIGELIIFTHAGDLKEYTVAEVVNIDDDVNDLANVNDTVTEDLDQGS